MRKFGGVSVPRLKNTAGSVPEPLSAPSEVKLPMSMHFGTPANLVVKVGDAVQVGQVIGEASGPVSAPVHASVSGTVKSIDQVNTLTGERAVTVTIASDGNQTPWEGIAPPQSIAGPAEFLEAVRNSGAVEPGSSGLPTAYELALDDYGKLEYLLVNGLESEPYITSDARAMTDDVESVWEGVQLLKTYLNPKNLIICIENDKPEAAKKIKALSAGKTGIEVREFPPLYPQGQKNVLAYSVTGRAAQEGQRLADVGCIVISCTAVAAIARYVRTGSPLVSRCVTVDGPAVKNPKNVTVPLGTPVSALIDHCGGLNDDAKKIIVGGPMTGAAVPTMDIPVVKTTSAVLAFSGKGAEPPEASACIKCGRCAAVCPMRLIPAYIENAFGLKKTEQLRDYKVTMCVECGCCAYSCPAKRPLAQVVTLAKNLLEAK